MSQYVIRVEGQLSPDLTSAFPSLDAEQHTQTLLQGPLEDPSALARVLDQLRALGVDVIAVHRLTDSEAGAAHAEVPRPH
jgi:hypothetical protein